jgi:hypothetical protein
MACESGELPEDGCQTADGRSVASEILAMLGELSGIEEKIVRMYFGIGYDRAYKPREIGEHLGVSKKLILELKDNAFLKLRTETGRSESEPTYAYMHACLCTARTEEEIRGCRYNIDSFSGPCGYRSADPEQPTCNSRRAMLEVLCKEIKGYTFGTVMRMFTRNPGSGWLGE